MKILDFLGIATIFTTFFLLICSYKIFFGYPPNWMAVTKILDSNFMVTTIATIAAAFFGAFGAQAIVEKTKNQERLIVEARNTNTAIILSLGICNSYLNIKENYLLDHKRDFDKDSDRILKALAKVRKKINCTDSEKFFATNFESFPPIYVPIDVLRKKAFEDISLNGEALTQVMHLCSSIDSLNRFIEMREEYIEKISGPPEKSWEDMAVSYFGFPDSAGHINRSNPDLLDGIYDFTNDCIHFSKEICESLYIHGQRIRGALKGDIVEIYKADFSAPENAGLFDDIIEERS